MFFHKLDVKVIYDRLNTVIISQSVQGTWIRIKVEIL